MFNKGDLIIYSSHGICCIDSICDIDVLGESKKYYILHPIENAKLKISIPVDSKKVLMKELVTESEAKDIFESFSGDGIEWIEASSYRNKVYSDILKNGGRDQISGLLNTLLRREQVAISDGKVFNERDSKLIKSIKSVLFKEMALALDISYEQVEQKVNNIMFS
ncbi:MAG: CarD family transcriptional regulator [Clostridium sp.]|uniref:CarD family transcriptional regulator n=1 Tax=Clostridium sp. TaxID=1506 RepID=UPI002FCA07F7